MSDDLIPYIHALADDILSMVHQHLTDHPPPGTTPTPVGRSVYAHTSLLRAVALQIVRGSNGDPQVRASTTLLTSSILPDVVRSIVTEPSKE